MRDDSGHQKRVEDAMKAAYEALLKEKRLDAPELVPFASMAKGPVPRAVLPFCARSVTGLLSTWST